VGIANDPIAVKDQPPCPDDEDARLDADLAPAAPETVASVFHRRRPVSRTATIQDSAASGHKQAAHTREQRVGPATPSRSARTTTFTSPPLGARPRWLCWRSG